MKRLIIILAAVIIPLAAAAQAQIDTKKVKISDFTQKTTKVVLQGNDFTDAILKEEIALRWRISPYEFCTLNEFEALKTSDQYYFLLTTLGQSKKESAPSLQFLSLVKGGKGAEKSVGNMLEIISLPYASAAHPSGRELVFLPALLDIIQNHTIRSMDSDKNGYMGLSQYTKNLQDSNDMQIIFFEGDINESVDRCLWAGDDRFTVTDEDSADKYMMDSTSGTLVSYVVAPTDPVFGSYCYKLLISAETHEIYFYRRHKITGKYGVGFLPEDFEYILNHSGKE